MEMRLEELGLALARGEPVASFPVLPLQFLMIGRHKNRETTLLLSLLPPALLAQEEVEEESLGTRLVNQARTPV